MRLFAAFGKFITSGATLLIMFGLMFLSTFVSAQNKPKTKDRDVSVSKNRASKTGYRLAKKYTIGGDAGWDYLAVDAKARRVYVTHYSKIEVLNADTGQLIGQITDTPGVHGIALVTKLGKGFTSNAKTESVSVIDLKTFKHLAEIKAGKKPDAIIYDEGTDRIFVSNGDSNDITVIDPKTDKALGTVALEGSPEFSAADGKGTVWVNLADKNAFATIDIKTMKATKTTSIEGCEKPTSMAFDATNRRLFIGCKSKNLVIVDPDSGKIIGNYPIGDHVDATVFDAAKRLIFVSTGEGILTIVRQDSADGYTLLDNVQTMRGAKTMALDTKTGKIFMATVENVPITATGPPKPIGKFDYVPGPFVVITIEK